MTGVRLLFLGYVLVIVLGLAYITALGLLGR